MGFGFCVGAKPLFRIGLAILKITKGRNVLFVFYRSILTIFILTATVHQRLPFERVPDQRGIVVFFAAYSERVFASGSVD